MTSVRGRARSIDEILAEARQRLRRLGPAETFEAMGRGAVLVDIRTEAQRAEQGRVPGALHVERNVLEWRFDPQSAARLPQATGYDVQVIVMCVEGYTSSLAAVALQDLGLASATDLDGGFRAWEKAGLPVVYGDESQLAKPLSQRAGSALPRKPESITEQAVPTQASAYRVRNGGLRGVVPRASIRAEATAKPPQAASKVARCGRSIRA